MLHLPLRTATAGSLWAVVVFLFSGAALGLDFNNQTLTGTILLPAGETHRFYNTITLNGATVELEGYLRNEQNPVTVTGNGVVNIRGPEGIWTDGWIWSHLTIDPGVEVQGFPDARFYPVAVNKGTIAAVPDPEGLVSDAFRASFDEFTNEGLIEARPDTYLDLYLRDGLFQNPGEIRIHVDATMNLSMETGEPLTPAALGAIHNDGLIEAEFFQVSGPGDIDLNGNGTWEFGRYSEVIGSTLNIPPTATARVVSTYDPLFRLSGATVNGVLESAPSADARVDGGLTLNGEWRLGPSAVVYFSGEQTIGGAGEIVATAGTALLRTAQDATTFGVGINLRVEPGAGLSLAHTSGQPTGGAFILEGNTSVDAGSLGAYTQPVTNRGSVRVTNGGTLTTHTPYIGYSFTNEGHITVESGARITLGDSFINQGTVTITDAELHLQGLPQGDNPISVTDSTIHVTNMTLSEIETLSPVRSDFVTGTSGYSSSIDLEGGTLTIADEDNRRWSLGLGGMENGTIASEDGFELAVVEGGGAVLRNVTLDADVRISAGQLLQINQEVDGNGRLIVDGGTLRFGGRGNQGAAMTSDALAMVTPEAVPSGSPVASVVQIYGPMDNTGRTIHLKAGAQWKLDVLRSTGITGGRIEGDPGVELETVGGYGLGDLIHVTLAVDTRVLTGTSIKENLILDNSTVKIVGGSNSQQTYSGRIYFIGEQELTGVGEVRFDSSPTSSELYPYSYLNGIETSGARLTIGSGITVRTSAGDGYLGDWQYLSQTGNQLVATPLTNHGLLLAENGRTLSLFTTQFEQHGTLRAETDSTLALFDDRLTNSGRLEAAGGVIEVSGDLTLDAASTLLVELSSDLVGASTAPLTVGGQLNLAGRLEATLAEGFAPSAGDLFPLASAIGLAGGLDSWQLPRLADGLYWSLNASATYLTLGVDAGAPAGDYNSDGVVDAADYTLWRDHRGAPSGALPNDTTGQSIGPAQYALWRANYGETATAPGPEASPAPEPAGLMLLGFGFSLLLRSPRLRPERHNIAQRRKQGGRPRP